MKGRCLFVLCFAMLVALVLPPGAVASQPPSSASHLDQQLHSRFEAWLAGQPSAVQTYISSLAGSYEALQRDSGALSTKNRQLAGALSSANTRLSASRAANRQLTKDVAAATASLASGRASLRAKDAELAQIRSQTLSATPEHVGFVLLGILLGGSAVGVFGFGKRRSQTSGGTLPPRSIQPEEKPAVVAWFEQTYPQG